MSYHTVEVEEEWYFWLQIQAPAGNWVDSFGSQSLDSVKSHRDYMRSLGKVCRMVTKTVHVIEED